MTSLFHKSGWLIYISSDVAEVILQIGIAHFGQINRINLGTGIAEYCAAAIYWWTSYSFKINGYFLFYNLNKSSSIISKENTSTAK